MSAPGCIPFEDLSAFVDGELPATEAARVREHVAACAACARALATLEGTARIVGALPRETASADLVAGVAARAARESAAAAPSPRASWTRWATAAAVLLGVLVMARVVQHESEQVRPEAELARQRAPAPPTPAAELAPAAAAPAAAPAVESDDVAPLAATAQATGAGPAFGAAPEVARAEALAEEKRQDVAVASAAVPPSPVAAPSPADATPRRAAQDAPAPSAPLEEAAGVEGGVLGGVIGGVVASEATRGVGAAPAARRADSAESDASLADAVRPKAAAAKAEAARANEATAESALASIETLDAQAPAAARAVPPLRDVADRTGPCDRVERVPLDQVPVLVTRVEPDWPDGRRSPAVRLRVVVNADGTVTPCGPALPADPARLAAATAAVSRWTFRPATARGVPHAAVVEVTLGE